jgi:hypothetical protein
VVAPAITAALRAFSFLLYSIECVFHSPLRFDPALRLPNNGVLPAATPGFDVLEVAPNILVPPDDTPPKSVFGFAWSPVAGFAPNVPKEGVGLVAEDVDVFGADPNPKPPNGFAGSLLDAPDALSVGFGVPKEPNMLGGADIVLGLEEKVHGNGRTSN